MASVFKKLLTPENLEKVIKFVSDKKNQELFGKVLHGVKDIVPKKKKEEPEPLPQYQKPKRRPQYKYYDDDDDDAYEEPVPAAEPKRRRRKGKKPLWDIPGISPEDKAEIMRIVSETERVKQETDEQIRMLIPNYKQPKKPKPKPLKRERPTVDIDPDMRPPPPKRRPIRAPEPDVPDDEEDIPPPLPPRNPTYERPLPPPPPDEPIEPPPLPPRPIQYQNIPPPPTIDAPEPPFEVEEVSVPIAPAPPPPPRLQFPQKPQRLLEQIREGAPLKHRNYSNPTRSYQPSGDLARSLMERRIRVAPSDDEGDYDDDDAWGTGKIKRSRRRVRGGAVLGL